MVVSSDSELVDSYGSYNGQVYFVPTNNWQTAIWVAARSTRFIHPNQDWKNPLDFTYLYANRSYSPMLWYTPSSVLGDEVYDFLHRLQSIGRITIFCEKPTQGLRELDQLNLKALLDECWERKKITPFIDNDKEKFSLIDIPLYKSEFHENSQGLFSYNFDQERAWLELDTELYKIFQNKLLPLPRVIIVLPSIPYFGAALTSLTSYIQGSLLYTNLYNGEQEDLCKSLAQLLADTAFKDPKIDEFWLVGPTKKLKPYLERAINQKREDNRRFEHTTILREIEGDNHFAASQQASVILLTYRYLDWMLLKSLKCSEGREYFFSFLVSKGMKNLYHFCNRILDLADQFRSKNFYAIRDMHTFYWSMNYDERLCFIREFQNYYKDTQVVSHAMAVVADYSITDLVPHNLIDAAAFAARRTAPLLLLQPLSTETSFYIGSLMDKIDEQIDVLNQMHTKENNGSTENNNVQDSAKTSESELNASNDSISTDIPNITINHLKLASNEQRKEIKKEIQYLEEKLQNTVSKTGEVLYESLVTLAIRSCISQINPKFLAVFIQDPSIPIELIKESNTIISNNEYSSNNNLKQQISLSTSNYYSPYKNNKFWGLCYAIGHISSINLYETNLTSNISFFAPRKYIKDDIRVILCSNPTRDLYFSKKEAGDIADLFEGKEVKIGEDLIKLDISVNGKSIQPKIEHLTIDKEAAKLPTKDNLITAFRHGYDIVHYSGHAFFDNVLPGRSGLLLNDNVLTASDVRFMLNLNRHPIIYANACSAGRIKNISSRFTGLASAFIRAGAAGYISSLWSIDDEEASAIAVTYYYTLLKENYPIGQCLQLAKKAQAETKSTITWVPLVLYGDPTLTIVYSSDKL